MRARELFQEGQVSANQCCFLLPRPLFELSFAFARRGKVDAGFKTQQFDGSIMPGGMAGNAALMTEVTMPEGIVEARIAEGSEEYLFGNVRTGICTRDEERIWRRMVGELEWIKGLNV